MDARERLLAGLPVIEQRLLHVIEDAADDPPIEQPEAFLRALHAALKTPAAPETAR